MNIFLYKIIFTNKLNKILIILKYNILYIAFNMCKNILKYINIFHKNIKNYKATTKI